MYLNHMMNCRLVFFALTMMLGSCSPFTQGPAPEPSRPFNQLGEEIHTLSGDWEYQEGNVVYLLRLNQLGNRTYDWQDGFFETHSLSHGLWKGIWRQMGNDREGGFEAILSESGDSAQGRWWYTRIEIDHQPLQPGGHFVLTRLPPQIGEQVHRFGLVLNLETVVGREKAVQGIYAPREF